VPQITSNTSRATGSWPACCETWSTSRTRVTTGCRT
jgi:hypothetical protein